MPKANNEHIMDKASIDSLIELSKQNPKEVYPITDTSVVFQGKVYTKDDIDLMIEMGNNPRAYRWTVNIINFWRRITFRKPI